MNKIKAIFMDVDGVLTDGSIIFGPTHELKTFNVRDGMGIHLARKSGLKVGFITGRTSKAVERRAEELKIDYLAQGCKDKLSYLTELLDKENLTFQEICYIGDDIPDILVLRKAGFSATVNDAPEYVKKEVDHVSEKDGGKGAVREIIEYILEKEGTLKDTIDIIIDKQ